MAARICIPPRVLVIHLQVRGMVEGQFELGRDGAAEGLSVSGGGVEQRTRAKRGDTVAEL
jgi:hypothetical protein